jgi:flavin-dependent dehydrogenase
MIDVLVVGGGPAGLATAIACAQRGLSVTVTEPRAGPVDKACGEGLMPATVRRLAGLGVHPKGHVVTGIRYLDSRGEVEALFRRGPGLGVRRTTLHTALADRASELEIPVLPVRVTEFSQRDSAGPGQRGQDEFTAGESGPGVTAAGIQARYLVAADGLHSAIRRACGLDPRPARHVRYGLRQHYRVAPWTSLVEVYWAKDSEAYVTPVAEDVVGVAVLGNGQASFESRLAAFPALRERLAGAEPASSVRGAGPLRQDVARRTKGRVLLVGDASGYLDALTGEGIGAALSEATALADSLAAGRAGDYERAWLQVTRTSRALTAGLLWSRNAPAIGPRIVPAARRLPWLFAAIVNQVAEA